MDLNIFKKLIGFKGSVYNLSIKLEDIYKSIEDICSFTCWEGAETGEEIDLLVRVSEDKYIHIYSEVTEDCGEYDDTEDLEIKVLDILTVELEDLREGKK